ncbi:hypothetical protein KC19_8G044800 [Ceratodon purpureus]|uniref:C2H2-type domain-containing protein n=1 Tax=Ceratodon purpureus TaxID=3225 RepID=A0A8T0GYS5_CERPU|nr:hypothetical protein KC19_8G044800 [Ceratodon purpureus]
MAKGLESYQHQVTLMEQKARNCGRGGRKAPTTRRRRSSRRPPRRKVLAHNVESSAREAMVCKDDDMADSTGYSTDGFERDEQQFIYDLERLSVPPKSVSDVKSMTQDGAPFAFQKRVERIDWRSLHSIDVDRLIREVDIDTLETVLDTIVFGDIQGEDRRNLSEANFVKIFRLAQLMVEYLLHVQALLAYHKSELLQSRTVLQQKNEKIRSRFLWQRDALLHTRHELKQAKKALQTYEVMLKIQGKNQFIQACQSNPKQVRHCHLCEKVFESPYYLNLHIARKHQQKQEVTEDKVLALVSRAEEATAARVKEEMSLAVQAEIQQLRKRYQADLRRTETGSNTQVRTLQEDLRQSDNRFHDVQARLEVLQAQIHSASPNKPKEKEDGPNQERLYELESRFSGLEHRLKTLGQENSRLLEELNVAYTKVSDLQFAKQQNVIQLETQVDGLQKENQQLKRTITKVNNIAEVTGEKPAEPYPEAYNQSPGNPTMDPVLICTSRLHSSALPKSLHPEVPRESFEMHEDTTNINRYVHIQKIPEPILAIIERKEPAIQTSDVLDFQKLNDTTDLGLIDEEPVALTPRERWTKEPDKDQALLALASPIPGIRRTEESSADSNAEPSEQESSAGPEHSRHSRSAGKRALGLPPQKMKYETSSERIKKPHKETPRLVAVKKDSTFWRALSLYSHFDKLVAQKHFGNSWFMVLVNMLALRCFATSLLQLSLHRIS